MIDKAEAKSHVINNNKSIIGICSAQIYTKTNCICQCISTVEPAN